MSTSHHGPEALVLLICHLCGLVHDDRERHGKRAGSAKKPIETQPGSIPPPAVWHIASALVTTTSPRNSKRRSFGVEAPVYPPGLWWSYRYEARNQGVATLLGIVKAPSPPRAQSTWVTESSVQPYECLTCGRQWYAVNTGRRIILTSPRVGRV